jgi:hypothetical protein
MGCTLAEAVSPKTVYLDQGWTDAQRQAYYHTSQGTRMLPYAWFMALEQPSRHPAQVSPPFHDRAYLATFGFIIDHKVSHNASRLPVGFAITYADGSGQEPPWMGITCAACHTGEIRYKDQVIRIDGGAAMVNLAAFEQATQQALQATLATPERFERFAKKLLGDNDSPENRLRLFKKITAFSVKRSKFLLTKHLQKLRRALFAEDEKEVRAMLHTTPDPGVGRLDALGKGGNYVFGYQMGIPENLVSEDGPVSYPPVWDAWMFDWVQYGGQIRQPMARNLAQALGVFTPVALRGSENYLFKSDVDVQALHRIESLLEQLGHPPWPEAILGKIDRTQWAKGKALFKARCATCHQPRWSGPDQQGNQQLQIKMVDVNTIGTDPNTVMNLINRTVNTGDLAPYLGVTTLPAFKALEKVTQQVVDRRYKDLSVPREQQSQLNGCRENQWRAVAQYRARPLNGIWTSAPFLHNGSVRNLWQLLGPVEERDKTFYVGSTVFEPDVMGFKNEAVANATLFDTTLPGNANSGHVFADAPRGNGVIGPALSNAERWAIIEYLKDAQGPVYPSQGSQTALGACQTTESVAVREGK